MRLTFSGLKRANECPASLILPQHRSSSSGAASKGTEIHAYLANVPVMGRVEALALVPEDFRAACEAIDLSTLPACDPKGWAVEIKLAYNPLTDRARDLGRGADRDYSAARADDVCGTLDVLGLTEDAVVVIDYKSGWADLGPVKDNMQLRGCALAACRAFDRERAHVAILRLKEDGESYYQWATLEAIDLAATQQSILSALGGAETAELLMKQGTAPVTFQGEWCGYCPAFPTCPAKTALARTMIGNVPDKEGNGDGLAPWVMSLPAMTKDNAPQIHEAIQRARELVSFMEDRLDEFAKVEPFELSNGWWYGPHPLPRDHIDASRALPIIEQLTDARVAEECVKVTRAVQKTLLTDAIRDFKARKPGVKIGATRDAILEALERDGAITRSFTHPIGKFKLVVSDKTQAALPSGETQNG